jgi:undecaprenyl-diphosphatase
MDRQLFVAINGMAGREPFLDVSFVALSRIGPFVLLAALAAAWFVPRGGRERRQRVVLLTGIATALALLLNQLLIHIWSRPRPSAVQAATLLLPVSPDPSFPSDHSTFAFAVAVGLLLLSWRIGLPALLLAALIAFSRVYTGAHYLSDVLGGAIIGSAFTLMAAGASRVLEPLLALLIRLAGRLRLG